jgi:hypothetical protein
MAELFRIFEGKEEVAITKAYALYFGDLEPVTRNAMQRLGSEVTRLNRRLKSQGLAVRPGRTKGTYRLVSAH